MRWALITRWALSAGLACLADAVEDMARPELDRPAVLALIATDPGAASDLGRTLFRHEFRQREGAGEARQRTMRAAQAQSCIVCHNVPYGEAGAGATIGRGGPTGRSTPHLFGAGQLARLGEAITRELLRRVDRDGDGTVSAAEARGVRAELDPGNGRPVDFGSFADVDGDGRPDLDPALRVWFVDGAGRRLPAARRWSDPGVAGYRFIHGPFGWSADDGEDPRSTASLRGFVVTAFAAHAGIEADDPGLAEVAASGLGPRSPAGLVPLYPGGIPDPGLRRDRAGHSLDDPDGDGVAAELAAAEVDLVEFYLATLRPPTERREAPRFAAGKAVFTALGCTGCHVSDWRLPGIAVSGLYSDLRHHDLGPAFHQARFTGGTTTRFRTPPLWGVGTSAPYGHDGASLDLDAVIRRHGVATQAYAELAEAPRDDLLAFLRSLELTP